MIILVIAFAFARITENQINECEKLDCTISDNQLDVYNDIQSFTLFGMLILIIKGLSDKNG